jgi:hypothetical protein
MSGTGNRVSPLQVSTLEAILNVLKTDKGEENKESKPTRILVSPKNDSKILNQKFSQAQVNIITGVIIPLSIELDIFPFLKYLDSSLK